MKRHRIVLSAFVALMVVLVAAPALAQADPSTAARAIQDTGVYVEDGSDLGEAEAAELVSLARNEGERLSIVVLTGNPGSGAVAFGDAVADRLANPGAILVITPDEFGVAGEGDHYDEADFDRAIDAADVVGGDADIARAFVGALTGTAIAGAPAEAATPDNAATSGEGAAAPAPAASGGGGFPWGLLLLVGGGLFLFMVYRRRKQQTAMADQAQVNTARAEIQKQLDAVANDLLDMEDEVRVADRSDIDLLYQTAARTYQEASDALGKAGTAAEFLEITNQLDVAVWQLDSAEALLDGKSPPPKPEPKRLEVPEPVTRRPAPPERRPVPRPDSGGGPLQLPPKPSYPDGGFNRRPSRRSGGGLSPSLIEILIGLGAGALGRRGRSGGGLFPRRTSAPPPRQPTRVPPPPSRTTTSDGRRDDGFLPSPTQRGSVEKPSTRRGSGDGTRGRIRMGRRRRRR